MSAAETQLSFLQRSQSQLPVVESPSGMPTDMVVKSLFKEAVEAERNAMEATHLVPSHVRIRVHAKGNPGVAIDVTNQANILVKKLPGKIFRLPAYQSVWQMEVFYGVYGGRPYNLPPGTVFGLHQQEEAVKR